MRRTELISLSPGTSIVSVKIGNPGLARKAWKKRRRSLSPVLMPCSVLGVPNTESHRMRILRDNVMFILSRYGMDWEKHVELAVGSGKGGGKGIYIKASEVARLYRREFRCSLANHAADMGYNGSVQDLLHGLLDERTQHEFGVELVESNGVLLLVGAISKRKARGQAFSCGMAEGVFDCSADGNEFVKHTGRVSVKRHKEAQPSLELLSAALRLPPKDTEKYKEGDEFNAFVFSFDQDGDAGEPLLIMSPEPSREQIRDGLKRKQNARRQMDARSHKLEIENNLLPISKKLSDLKVGNGPYTGRVVHISSKSGAAFLDLGVGRPRRKVQGGGESNVFGMLRLNEWVDFVTSQPDEIDDECDNEVDDDDDVESLDDLFMSELESGDIFSFGDDDKEEIIGEEIIEDVTDQFKLDEDGMMYKIDEKNGELNVLGSIEGEFDGDSSDEDEMFAGLSPEERLEAIQDMLSKEEDKIILKKKYTPGILEIDEEVEVYISSVSTQSGRFMVTLDSSIQGRSAIDLKREKNAEKRLSKLESNLGEKLLSLKGIECDGIVKAKSKTGNWYYVQPDGDHNDLPVGVANFEDDQASFDGEAYAPGDRVRIRFEGVDDTRGQLAMSLLH